MAKATKVHVESEAELDSVGNHRPDLQKNFPVLLVSHPSHLIWRRRWRWCQYTDKAYSTYLCVYHSEQLPTWFLHSDSSQEQQVESVDGSA